MYCENCGRSMQWRSTNQLTNIAKWKCPCCGHIQESVDDYKPLDMSPRVPKYYYVKNGRYVVRGGRFKNKQVYIGTYGDEETAKLVVEKMKECSWRKEFLPLVRQELNIEKVNGTWVCV